jgi:nuclear pore complex protein Nup85
MLINKDRDSDYRESYWNVLRSLILQGQADIARALLKLNSASETMTFQLAEKELHSMPVFNIHGGLSLQKFRSQWSFWLTSLRSKIDSGLFSSEPELEFIMKLITGNRESWQNVCKTSNCWYEYFAGYLFYTQPAVRYFELGTFADNWLTEWATIRGNTGYTTLKSLDRMVLAVLKNDMAEFIHSVQEVGDNRWFVVHLVDLLVHSDQLKISNDSNGLSEVALRENLIFDYGTMLMSKGTLWEIGSDYLEFSSPEGIGAREMLLERVPIRNDIQATKVIEVARKFNMTSVEQRICRIMVKRSLSHENYGNALEWAIRSRDNIYVTKVANIFLHHYCNTGKMLHKDVLANFGAKMFAAPRLLFLIKYFDFYQFYVAHAYSQAAELLISLLESKIIPEFFWPSLMTDTIPLLEHNEPIIPSKETYTILHHLESDLIPYVEKMKLEKNTTDETELNLINACPDDLVETLRLACARNLKRAMIIENTLIR